MPLRRASRYVALYARAWVEIWLIDLAVEHNIRRPLREGVGRNPKGRLIALEGSRRPLREGVGRNMLRSSFKNPCMGRPLREGVGRNGARAIWYLTGLRRPLREGVGRNRDHFIPSWRSWVALYARAWVEIDGAGNESGAGKVALYARAWVEIGTGKGRVGAGKKSPSTRGRG